jgi:hypothetical protein
MLVDKALRAYPELAAKKDDFLKRQLFSINMQQADHDYGVAEFYRRTGHTGSAYFCYEIVRRRYPNTKYSELATQRMSELRHVLDKKGQDEPAPPMPEGTGRAPAHIETAPAPRPVVPGTQVTPPPVETAPQPRTLPPGVLGR